MNRPSLPPVTLCSASLWVGLFVAAVGWNAAAEPPTLQFANLRVSSVWEVAFDLHAPPGSWVTLDESTDLTAWSAARTVTTAGAVTALTHPLRSATGARFLRARIAAEGVTLAGDHLSTTNGDVTIHPVDHASLVLRWQGRTVYIDPVGGAAPYQEFPRADLALVTHTHGDHFHPATLTAVLGAEGVVVAPAAVYTMLPASLRDRAVPLANGESTNLLGVSIEAVPAYNDRHPKGVGNGYVLGLGGRRIYASGDTGAVPEIRVLEAIDVAFLCMNLPFTMSVSDAAGLIRDFRPRVVYPYHYRNQDQTFANLMSLRQQVGTDLDVEVRLRAWY